MFGKKNVSAVVAEFLGTGVLTMLVLSVQRSTIGVPFFVAAMAGLTIFMMMYALVGVSGANFNPALTLALWTARKASTARAVFYIGAQLLGAWVAYYLYTYLVGSKLTFIGGHYTARILVAEAFGTALFGFAFAALSNHNAPRSTKSAVAGLAFMVAMVASSTASIGLVNPALALGVRAWVWGTYVLGPVLGAVLGVNLYNLFFVFKNDDKDEALVEVNNYDTNFTVINEVPAKKTTSSKSKKPAAKKPAAKKSNRRQQIAEISIYIGVICSS